MVSSLLKKIFGTSHERQMKILTPMVQKIASYEAQLKTLSNADLQNKTVLFKERFARGENLNSLLPEAFAVCREASSRILGMRHYDVQMIGGMVLHKGGIAEMRTGEGKTLVATLPMYLNALAGKGAHLVTVNDYLAKRDCEWMGRLYNFMGLSTGTIVHERSDSERKAAYGADITYGTNNEFGFDYLRDNMKYSFESYVQRPFFFGIVDECDSILIDEARTPLIISGPAEESTDMYEKIDKIIPNLKKDIHFTMEEKSRTVSLTEEGNSKAEELLGVGNLYDPQNLEYMHHIYQALKAHHLYKRDVEYMIANGEIVIVDEFTGRLMPGRRWSDGLHQAVEAKEKVKIRSENQTLATVTFQNFFRMYEKLSGMTGTAETEAVEFKKIYNLDVTVIPTNKGIRRLDEDDLVYKNENGKFNAIVKDILGRHEKHQPVLVGTVSIEKSEGLSAALKRAGIKHNVLNAKHHEREAEIVAQAGRKGAITIATNMAGRGTDIVLGGNPEFLARAETHGVEKTDPENAEKTYQDALANYKRQCEREKEDVLVAGGLYIIGTERHESRRIDNQLRGRSGRQGDPGESRFYLSLEDDLMRKFNGERIQKLMEMMKFPDDEPINAPMVSGAIENAQKKVEGHNFDMRKHLLDYDDVMNKQRTVIYGLRRDVLKGDGLDRISLDMFSDVASSLLDTFAHENLKPTEWDLEGLKNMLVQHFGCVVDESSKAFHSRNNEDVVEMIRAAMKAKYEEQKQEIGELWPQVQRMVLLEAIDTKWKDHLQIIETLREGINLRAYAQKDPLIEYKKEGFVAFERMNLAISTEVVEKLLRIRIVSKDETEQVLSERAQRELQKDLKFQGSEAAEELAKTNGALRPPAGRGLGSAQPSRANMPSQPLMGRQPPASESYGDEDEMPTGNVPAGMLRGGRGEPPQMNRAQRRQMDKKAKKRF
jgi:preprotein translocase subunit SecA